MDAFAEQLFDKENSSNERFIKYSLLILGIIILLFTAFYALTWNFVLFLLCALEVYGLCFLMKQFHMEYEYSIVNGQLDVDVIYAKSRRKHIASIDCTAVFEIGKTDRTVGNSSEIMAANASAENKLYLSYSSEKGNKTIVLQPSEKIIDVMKCYIPRSVTMNIL